MAKKVGTDKKPTKDDVVVFEYIKSQFFRVIHADGALGGITPTGNVHIAFYSDRAAIPKIHVHRKNPDGTLGELLRDQTVVRPGIIREMDVDVILSPEATEALMRWLADRLRDLKRRRDRLSKGRK